MIASLIQPFGHNRNGMGRKLVLFPLMVENLKGDECILLAGNSEIGPLCNFQTSECLYKYFYTQLH